MVSYMTGLPFQCHPYSNLHFAGIVATIMGKRGENFSHMPWKIRPIRVMASPVSPFLCRHPALESAPGEDMSSSEDEILGPYVTSTSLISVVGGGDADETPYGRTVPVLGSPDIGIPSSSEESTSPKIAKHQWNGDRRDWESWPSGRPGPFVPEARMRRAMDEFEYRNRKRDKRSRKEEKVFHITEFSSSGRGQSHAHAYLNI